MANIIQRFIYNLSIISPLCFVFAFVWYVQEGTLIVPIISVATGLVFIGLFACSFSYGKKHFAPIQIRTSEIKAYDNWIALYVISYMVPFTSIVISEFNIVLCGGLDFVLIVVLSYMNSAIPNPLLFIRKYHFYLLDAENGISEYVLISKRRIRRKQDIQRVNRIFDFLLLDTEGR